MEHSAEFDELAGRIDGMGRALLRLAAALEVQGLIDGPRLSAAWTAAAQPHSTDTAQHHSSHKTLRELVYLLDDARAGRQAAGRPL